MVKYDQIIVHTINLFGDPENTHKKIFDSALASGFPNLETNLMALYKGTL